MGSGGTFCPQKSFESTGSRRERAHPLDGCQESIACARSEHGSRRDGSRSGVALGFERATWARRRGRPVGRVRSAPSRRAGSIRPLAGAAARPAAAVVPAAASASASRANWLAFDERPSSQNPDCHLKGLLPAWGSAPAVHDWDSRRLPGPPQRSHEYLPSVPVHGLALGTFGPNSLRNPVSVLLSAAGSPRGSSRRMSQNFATRARASSFRRYQSQLPLVRWLRLQNRIPGAR